MAFPYRFSGDLQRAFDWIQSQLSRLDTTTEDQTDRLDSLEAGVRSGNGSPAGVLAAPVGTIYRRLDGGAATTLYIKESGTGTAGWVAK